MKYLAAYLLLVQGGNASPAAADISAVLEAAGIESEESRISALLSELEGKDINELIAEGNTKFASVPSGGAAVSSSGAGAAAGGAAAEEAAEEEAAEDKEESDDDMGFGLFD
ncbi:60S acidic ribosomal protein P2-B [Spathaspora sp. JA1]|nr:60S acidic ribosomal protein P2-B [Spathaspora sp. JA1]